MDLKNQSNKTCKQVRVRTDVRAGGGYVAGKYYPDKSGSCDKGVAIQLPGMYPVEGGSAVQLPSFPWMGGNQHPPVDMSGYCGV